MFAVAYFDPMTPGDDRDRVQEAMRPPRGLMWSPMCFPRR